MNHLNLKQQFSYIIKFFIFASAALLVACASAPPPTSASWEFTVPMVSKTKSVPPAGKLKSLGNVSEKFCQTEGKLSDRIGMMDSLILKAQAKYKADYISNAKFSRIDDFCMSLVGTAVSANGTSPGSATP